MIDEKVCPRCAETVKEAAQVCRFCGYQFKRRSDLAPLWALNGVLLLAAIFGSSSGEDEPDSGTLAPPVPSLTAEQRKGCGEALAQASKDGIVRQRPEPRRVNVDDAVGARMAADEKSALLALVACDAFGKRGEELRLGEGPVVAYGFRSGKRWVC